MPQARARIRVHTSLQSFAVGRLKKILTWSIS